MTAQILEADWTWVDGRLQSGLRVSVGPSGEIDSVGADLPSPSLPLPGQALFPGMVNAHSHAFQRALRGFGERFPSGAGSFWTWREAMYDLVATMEPGTFRRICHHAFEEMLDAGITTVGEFHYLHHLPDGDDYALDGEILAAAREAGIRLVLLNTFYQTGGIGQALAGAQRQFGSIDADRFLSHQDALASTIDPVTQTLGTAIHSVRAAPPDVIGTVYREARRRGQVVHIHVEEQRREIEACRAAYGGTPMTVVLDATGSADGLTAVHCTHTTPDDLARFRAQGGVVCLCPLTEANLGDGVAPLPDDSAHDATVIGTDSNARISMMEEMRWMEYTHRLTSESRGAIRNQAGQVASAVFRMATEAGATSLQVPSGRIAAGRLADFFTVDLTHASVRGVPPDHLLDALVFGTGGEPIANACVGGRWRRDPGACAESLASLQ